MLNLTKNIQSLTTFRRKSAHFIKHLKKSKRPLVQSRRGEDG